jgi:hypothetical protein
MRNPTGSPTSQANFHGQNVEEARSRLQMSRDEMERHRSAAEAAEERIVAFPRREHGTRATTAIVVTVFLALIDWPAMFVTAQATRARTITEIILIAAAGTALNSALGWQIGWHLRRRRDADAPSFEAWFTNIGFVALAVWLGLLFAIRANAADAYGLNPWVLAGLLTMFAAVVALLSVALGYGVESRLVSDTRTQAADHWRLWRAAKKDVAEHKPDYERAVQAADRWTSKPGVASADGVGPRSQSDGAAPQASQTPSKVVQSTNGYVHAGNVASEGPERGTQ